jgi:hypothetical protein
LRPPSGAPPILEEPNGYRHDVENAHLLRKESLSRNSLFRQPPAPSIALASLPSQASVRNSKFACIDTAGEIISSSATDTLSALPHRIVHRARLLAKLVKCYEVTITTLRSGLPSHDLSSVRIFWSSPGLRDIWTGPRFFRSSRPQQLIAGEVVSLKALADDEGLDAAEIRRLLPPRVSVPTIVEAILAGNQPANLTVSA